MKTLEANMFLQSADAICLTTNGIVKGNGVAVMGRGNALQAKRNWYGIDKLLGRKITRRGNRCHRLTRTDANLPYLKLPRTKGHLIIPVPWHIISFPVKLNWRDSADLKLIAASCRQLKKMVDKMEWQVVLLPRPGCGNGKLSWKKDVKPIIKKCFQYDDRIVIANNKEA